MPAVVLPFPRPLPMLRPAIEATIEQLIDILDAVDAVSDGLEPDCDSEDSCDAEKETWSEWVAWVATRRIRGRTR